MCSGSFEKPGRPSDDELFDEVLFLPARSGCRYPPPRPGSASKDEFRLPEYETVRS